MWDPPRLRNNVALETCSICFSSSAYLPPEDDHFPECRVNYSHPFLWFALFCCVWDGVLLCYPDWPQTPGLKPEQLDYHMPAFPSLFYNLTTYEDIRNKCIAYFSILKFYTNCIIQSFFLWSISLVHVFLRFYHVDLTYFHPRLLWDRIPPKEHTSYINSLLTQPDPLSGCKQIYIIWIVP